MAFLTDRSLATGVTLDDLIHIVITGDTSQGNPFPSMGGMNVVPLDAPTMFPEEPGTAGIDAGPGVGSEAMMDLPRYKSNPRDTIAKVAMFDDTGEVELILSKFI